MTHCNKFDDAEDIRVCQGDIDYQGIVKHINDGVVIIREGTIVFANNAFYEISQKKPDQVISSVFSDFISASDRERVSQYCTEQLFTEGISDRIEFVMPKENGEAIIMMKVSVVECGGIPAILGALTDITERRKTRVKLQKIKERLESILHSMNEVVVSMSPDGYQILAINPAAEALYGVPLRNFISGQNHIMSFVHPDDIGKVRQFYDNLSEAEFDGAQYRIVGSNKKIRWVFDEGHVVYSTGCKSTLLVDRSANNFQFEHSKSPPNNSRFLLFSVKEYGQLNPEANLLRKSLDSNFFHGNDPNL